ncbi:asparagine synthase (glutamine-hydrolyzing), partial [archaeon]|nr:asparagine synthase (glutamine-hydrolyzing) [archaeon]
MCGINVLYTSKSIDRSNIIEKMNDSISHRGPDNSDSYSDDYISLGHTRLSIVDLSKKGNQPMYSNDKRYIIVFNGEIYNFNELMSQLNYNFTTTTDTEVVLASYLKWGEKCVNYFNGMFAFAIWDSEKKELFVTRDRLGIKPLYYYFDKSTFIFSSEIRSILRTNLVDKKLCIQGLNEYLKYQTVNYPNTIIRDLKVLEPASFIVFRNYKIIKKSKYWSPNKKPIDINGYSYNKLKNKVLQELTNSVELRMFSDVDSGAFLSGGVDSSTMVGLMSKLSNKKIKTFNISFNDNEYSESKYARLVSKQFNTDHTEINLKPETFLNYIPNALNDMDHPSGDGPNSWVVSKFTRKQGVKMVFSGLGGDELFAGYKSFKR